MSNQIRVALENWRGYSAYEVAVRNGFRGTEAEWLAQLHGRDGGVSSVNGVAHDEYGNVLIGAENVPVNANDERTLKDVVRDVDALTGAIAVTDDGIDLGNRYVDNARFR